MPEATTATAAAVAGGGAMVLALLGVEPQALAWAMVGAIFGSPLAPPAGRVRQVLVFLAVILACGLLGTVAADMHGGGARWRNAWCLVLAGVFHPLAAAVAKAAPGLFVSMLTSLVQRKTGGNP